MAGKQMANDSFASNLAGMSKTQLYDIMSQMKVLIEQNQQQARNILIENPTLTRALFQAQIMLGMVKPPQTTPIIQQAPPPQPPQQAVQPIHLPSTQTQLFPPQVTQDVTSRVPIPVPTRKQVSNAPMSTISSTPIQPLNHQHPQQQSKGQQHMNTQGQGTPMTTHPQSVQIQNMLPHQQLHPSQQQQQQQQQPPSYHHSQVQHISMQQQHQQQQQPPLPPQPRPPSMQPYHPQPQYQNPHGGYQTSQSQYQNPNRHPGNIGYGQGQGQPPLPSQPPPHSMYQVSGSGSHMGTDYGNQQGGGPMQVDRSPWMQPGPSDVPQQQQQLPGPPPLPGLMGPGSQPPPRPAQVPNEVEKQLLQQVMNLTPDQINLLPPEQRQQVFQLQQMMHGGGRP
ncbi:hypothetical protein ACHQM5_009198 [Ranunculus cassubicifolius]